MPEKAGVKAKKKKKKKFRSSKKATEQEGVMRDPQGKIANLLHTMFNEIDRDQGGTISTGELCKYLRTKLKKLDISGNLQQQMLADSRIIADQRRGGPEDRQLGEDADHAAGAALDRDVGGARVRGGEVVAVHGAKKQRGNPRSQGQPPSHA